ncbi:hypothetical protein OCK74_10865 [Chitinophagaceae bacterium LB-8]|jgi:hypothetical protein|uniref:Uncharacterized protein n=1 Tax=Paraflavisolibacter caeni TaxID=2982496 RepID=A0A9X2XUN6_9BACT|nr:hypothetical protein [Paraflavisolibacter caeni]MCU7549619.1 hypothetical protein [Paraflavisolibacter caeni]
MNIYFSKVIKVGDKQREFNFRKLPGNSQTSYHVDVTDDKGTRLVFSMYKDASGRWHTSAQTLPIWIHNAEEILGNVIEEETKDFISLHNKQ